MFKLNSYAGLVSEPCAPDMLAAIPKGLTQQNIGKLQPYNELFMIAKRKTRVHNKIYSQAFNLILFNGFFRPIVSEHNSFSWFQV